MFDSDFHSEYIIPSRESQMNSGLRRSNFCCQRGIQRNEIFETAPEFIFRNYGSFETLFPLLE